MSGRPAIGLSGLPPASGPGSSSSGAAAVGSGTRDSLARKHHRRGSRDSILPPAYKNHLNSLFKGS